MVTKHGRDLKVSKLDAAKRQLETAIRLYFSNGDPVSIHTLSAAAYEILFDISKRRGAEPMFIKDKFIDLLRPESQRKFAQKVNEAENFFKHADRDPEATLDFNPGSSEYLMWDACWQYSKLTGEEPPLFTTHRVWFMANNPDFFNPPEEFEEVLHGNAHSIVQMGRARYFAMALPAFMSIT